MNIEDFFEQEYVVFANYRTTQRLPNYDGLIETQRKVIYTFLNLNKVNKERTVTLASDAMKYTHYNHGDKSMTNVINTLAAEWQNNIPLLMEDGSFGYRSNNRAADPRYTQTRIRNYLKILFNPIDNEQFIEKQYDGDGKEVEPLSLIPILPLLIINGQTQIGVGFASKTLPRNPNTIISLIKDILQKKTKIIPNTIEPWYWCYKGSITAVPGNDLAWTFRGLFKRGKNNTIIIEEIPMKYDREKYIKFLNDLKEPKEVKVPKSKLPKKKKGETTILEPAPKKMVSKIISFKENINENDFYIEVKVDTATYNLPDDKIIDLLNLEARESEFINIINEAGEILTEFKSLGQYLYLFIKWRLSVYIQRKDYLLREIEKDINRINAIIRFIQLVNENKINIHKQTRTQIEAQIEANQFEKIDNSFSYLINLKIYDLTEEKIKDYKEEIGILEKQKEKLEKQTPADLWLADIEEFEKIWKKSK
jgi:DNA topoisomerase-2